jgi:hypothetical protein
VKTRREKTRLKAIVETIMTADLRLRLAPDLSGYPLTVAIRELEAACRELSRVIAAVRAGEYP